MESRGRGVRLQVLTPIPRGDSLAELSEQMQRDVDRLAPQRVWERFATEEPTLRPLPELAFEGAAAAAGLSQPQCAGAS